VLEQEAGTGLVRTVPAARWSAGGFTEERGWGRLARLCALGGDGSAEVAP
jgi:pilus assembly protein CpaF